MKNLLTSALLLLSITAFSQVSIHAGLSNSWFAGKDRWSGFKLNSQGFTGGFAYKAKFYRSHFYLQPEINYITQGARNPDEGKRNFYTRHVQLGVNYGADLGKWSLSVKPYVNRLVRAENYNYFGSSFSWQVSAWDYYKKWTYGAGVSLSYDFIGMEAIVSYNHGLTNVRASGHDYYNDPKMMYDKDRALLVQLCIPFKKYK